MASMPRILPRLLERIAHTKEHWSPFVLPRHKNKRKSLYKPVPPRPSFNPVNYPQSILLSSPGTNPITSSHVYAHHKTLPPRFRVPKHGRVKPSEHDRPKEMSDEEHEWWSSPYLRMLASPIRKCVITNRYLPTDFLIRLSAMRVPMSLLANPKPGESLVQTTLIPDGLQHSKFTARKSGGASYILCKKDSIPILVENNLHKRIAPNMSVHPLLAEQIAHMLRVRVLQEFELLTDRLESLIGRPEPQYKARIIRRLTRNEWINIQATGIIPYPNAIAVLVVPPLNKDITTKERPKPSMSTSPLVELDRSPILRAPLPLSILKRTTALSSGSVIEDERLSQMEVPLYNGASLFPVRQQRAALRGLLTRLLKIERQVRGRPLETQKLDEGSGKKASHAFILFSDSETSKRADVAAVAIALWRIRMFEDSSEPDDRELDTNTGWVGSPNGNSTGFL